MSNSKVKNKINNMESETSATSVQEGKQMKKEKSKDKDKKLKFKKIGMLSNSQRIGPGLNKELRKHTAEKVNVTGDNVTVVVDPVKVNKEIRKHTAEKVNVTGDHVKVEIYPGKGDKELRKHTADKVNVTGGNVKLKVDPGKVNKFVKTKTPESVTYDIRQYLKAPVNKSDNNREIRKPTDNVNVTGELGGSVTSPGTVESRIQATENRQTNGLNLNKVTGNGDKNDNTKSLADNADAGSPGMIEISGEKCLAHEVQMIEPAGRNRKKLKDKSKSDKPERVKQMPGKTHVPDVPKRRGTPKKHPNKPFKSVSQLRNNKPDERKSRNGKLHKGVTKSSSKIPKGKPKSLPPHRNLTLPSLSTVSLFTKKKTIKMPRFSSSFLEESSYASTDSSSDFHVPRYQCSYCQYTTVWRMFLYQHVEVHSRHDSVVCDMCDITFKNERSMNKWHLTNGINHKIEGCSNNGGKLCEKRKSNPGVNVGSSKSGEVPSEKKTEYGHTRDALVGFSKLVSVLVRPLESYGDTLYVPLYNNGDSLVEEYKRQENVQQYDRIRTVLCDSTYVEEEPCSERDLKIGVENTERKAGGDNVFECQIKNVDEIAMIDNDMKCDDADSGVENHMKRVEANGCICTGDSVTETGDTQRELEPENAKKIALSTDGDKNIQDENVSDYKTNMNSNTESSEIRETGDSQNTNSKGSNSRSGRHKTSREDGQGNQCDDESTDEYGDDVGNHGDNHGGGGSGDRGRGNGDDNDGDGDKNNNNVNSDGEANRNHELLPCLICLASYSRKQDLMRHLTKIHRLTNLCQICYFDESQIRRFANPVSLRNHKVRDHPEDMVKCVCGAMLIDNKMLTTHLKKFKCNMKGTGTAESEMIRCICGKRFGSQELILNHRTKCRKRSATEAWNQSVSNVTEMSSSSTALSSGSQLANAIVDGSNNRDVNNNKENLQANRNVEPRSKRGRKCKERVQSYKEKDFEKFFDSQEELQNKAGEKLGKEKTSSQNSIGEAKLPLKKRKLQASTLQSVNYSVGDCYQGMDNAYMNTRVKTENASSIYGSYARVSPYSTSGAINANVACGEPKKVCTDGSSEFRNYFYARNNQLRAQNNKETWYTSSHTVGSSIMDNKTDFVKGYWQGQDAVADSNNNILPSTSTIGSGVNIKSENVSVKGIKMQPLQEMDQFSPIPSTSDSAVGGLLPSGSKKRKTSTPRKRLPDSSDSIMETQTREQKSSTTTKKGKQPAKSATKKAAPKKKGRKKKRADADGRYACKTCRQRYKRPYLYIHQKMVHAKKQWVIVPTSMLRGKAAGASEGNGEKYRCGWCKFISIHWQNMLRHHYMTHKDAELDVIPMVALAVDSPPLTPAKSDIYINK